MPIKSTDNRPAVNAQLQHNISKTLEMLGLKNQEIVTKIMSDPEYYGVDRDIVVTGRLRGSMTYRTSSADKEVVVGTNVEYAIDVHEGTSCMRGRPFLKDSILGYKDDYREIIENTMNEGI